MKLLKFKKYSSFLFTFFFIVFFSPLSFSKQDYCSYNVDKLASNIIIIDASSIKNSDSIMLLQDGYEKILTNTVLGQKVILYKFTKDGNPQQIFEECKPGCPDSSILDRIIGGKCNHGQSVVDVTKFNKKFITSILLTINASPYKNINQTLDNPLVSKLYSLSNEFKQLSKDDEIFIFSDLIEMSNYGDFNLLDENEFHKAFVRVINDKNIPYNYGNNINFFGIESSSLVLEFWEDIFNISNSSPNLYSNLLE